MHKIHFNGKALLAENGQLLSEILMENGGATEHLCAGRGVCGKCAVKVNGKTVLSCRYKVESDIVVEEIPRSEITSVVGENSYGEETENMCYCLDIGTTTLALALVSLDSGKIIKVVTATNPQRIYGADVISRIDFCSKNGVEKLQRILITKVNLMIKELCSNKIDKMYVSANATMLHIFFGEDCSSIGVAPYKAKFLENQKIEASLLGIENVAEIESLPSIHAFAGADIIAGLNFVGLPKSNKYNLLVDLGTNAEIALFSKEKTISTSAAAGPCFEGASISCGMSATEGAIYSYKKGSVKTIGNTIPKGVCGTGLVDIVAQLLSDGAIDETGHMEKDFSLSYGVILTQEDVREFQQAKSAVCSGIQTLINEAGISFEDVEKVYISGGFSEKLSIENAVKTGLLPEELSSKCVAINNSSLLGTVKYACGEKDLSAFLRNAEYIDLSSTEKFSQLFIENMMF